jgi:hypothetical protein
MLGNDFTSLKKNYRVLQNSGERCDACEYDGENNIYDCLIERHLCPHDEKNVPAPLR